MRHAQERERERKKERTDTYLKEEE